MMLSGSYPMPLALGGKYLRKYQGGGNYKRLFYYYFYIIF